MTATTMESADCRALQNDIVTFFYASSKQCTDYDPGLGSRCQDGLLVVEYGSCNDVSMIILELSGERWLHSCYFNVLNALERCSIRSYWVSQIILPVFKPFMIRYCMYLQSNFSWWWLLINPFSLNKLKSKIYNLNCSQLFKSIKM